jgi:tetraacyldisaccharide 4'-kinase
LLKLVKILLVPFIPLYAAAVALRNKFFDINFFKSKKADAAVISVGNITMGGSGKTPSVIYLLNLLKNNGYNPGVLSRGYGRRTKGYLLVSEGKGILTGVDECGDEIYHTVLECSVPAAVSENRVTGAEKLINKTGIDTLVLDDAYQHRWIHRDLNLLIFEQRFLLENNSMINKFLLPSGILREPFRGIKRADAVILNRKFSELKEIPVDFRKYFRQKSYLQPTIRQLKWLTL